MTEQLDPRLAVTFAVAGLFAILLPIALMLFVRRRLGAAWTVFALGAAAFAVSQLLTRLPLVVVAQIQLKDVLAASAPAQLAWIGVLAVTAGLFEETARYLCYRYFLKDGRTWSNAVALGTGHGGIESVLLVGVSLIGQAITVIVLTSTPGGIPGATAEISGAMDQVRAVLARTAWWLPLLGGYERLCSVAVHVALSVLVLRAFTHGNIGWFWASVAFHAASNAAAVLTMRAWGPVAAEGVLTLFLIASVWIIFRFRPRAESLAPAAG